MSTVKTIRLISGIFINYTYIVYNNSYEGIIIDPAWEVEKIIDSIEENNIKLFGIFITHRHEDHIHSVLNIANKYDIPIYLSEHTNKNLFLNSKKLNFIKNENAIIIKDLEIKPLLTPGHTKDGICYLIGSKLFTGDTLFIEGCGMCADVDSDPSALFNSIQKIILNTSLNTRIYPGHRYDGELGQTFEEVRNVNIYLHFENQEDFVKFRMRRNQKNLMDWI